MSFLNTWLSRPTQQRGVVCLTRGAFDRVFRVLPEDVLWHLPSAADDAGRVVCIPALVMPFRAMDEGSI